MDSARKRIRLICGSAVLLWSCGDNSTPDGPVIPPPPGGGGLDVTPDSVQANALGEALVIQVRLGGQAVTPVLSVRSERRWLDDRPIVDAAELAAGRLMAHGPGRAVISVAAGNQTDSVIVNVIPGRPLVIAARLPGGRSHVGDNDTVVLRGFRMNQVTAGQLLATNVTPVFAGADSANLRIVFPTASTGPTCSGAAQSIVISYNGIDGLPLNSLTRKRTGELSLAVGESARLTNAQAPCIRFTPAPAAQYLLAYADTRLLRKARTQAEWPWPDSVLVSVADRTGTTSPVVMNLPAAAATKQATFDVSGPVQALAPPSGCPFNNSFQPFCRATPYTLGEVFTHYPAGSTRPAGNARVLGVRGNLVLSVFLTDSSQLVTNAVARADTALQTMVASGIPLLQQIWGLAQPTRTSDESGQLFLMIEETTFSFANWWPDPTSGSGHGRWGKVTLHLGPNTAFGHPELASTAMLQIIAHEVMHTYQFRWRYEHAAPWISFLGSGWAVEGGAALFQSELTRSVLGLPFLGNENYDGIAVGDARFPLSTYAYSVVNLTAGYGDAASMLRDFVQRLVVSGMSFDAALREVLVGAMEGWYGINEEGIAAGPGLTARMRQRLGAQWEPVDALLDWTMSQAADDLTDNPRFQNLTVRRTMPATSTNMIRPHSLIRNGLAFSVRRPPGNTGVFEIEDAAGGSYAAEGTVQGTPSDALEWLVLRIR
jgi:hypothetical protein